MANEYEILGTDNDAELIGALDRRQPISTVAGDDGGGGIMRALHRVSARAGHPHASTYEARTPAQREELEFLARLLAGIQQGQQDLRLESDGTAARIRAEVLLNYLRAEVSQRAQIVMQQRG